MEPPHAASVRRRATESRPAQPTAGDSYGLSVTRSQESTPTTSSMPNQSFASLGAGFPALQPLITSQAGFVGNRVSVWVIGSSLIRDAFFAARTRPGGLNLGWERLNGDIWWQGYGGMRIQHLKPQIETLLTYDDPLYFWCCMYRVTTLVKQKLGTSVLS